MTEKEQPKPQLQVRVEATIAIEVNFDVIEYFQRDEMKTPQTQRNYWGLNLDEWGFDGEEYCRPIAWLNSEVYDAYELGGLHGFGPNSPIHDRTGDIEFDPERVDYRSGARTGSPSSAGWTEEDFEVLAAAVPWVGRIPGPVPEEPPSLPLFPIISTDVVSSSAGG